MPRLSVKKMDLRFRRIQADYEWECLVIEARQRELIADQLVSLQLNLLLASFEPVVIRSWESVSMVKHVVFDLLKSRYVVKIFKS